MKKNKRFISAVICVFLAFFVLLLHSDYCYSSYDNRLFEECLKQFKQDLQKLQKTNESFLKRHLWKIVGSCIALIIFVTGVIIFFTGGTAAPVAAPPAAMSCCIAVGGGLLAAWLWGIGIFASPILAGYLIDEFKKQGHGGTVMIEKISDSIVAQKDYIMGRAVKKEDIYKEMNLIAAEVVKKANR